MKRTATSSVAGRECMFTCVHGLTECIRNPVRRFSELLAFFVC